MWLFLSSIADVLIISILASRGIAMVRLPLPVLLCEFAAAIAYGLLLCGIKIPVFHRLAIS
jgi:hypothetical protein